MDESQVPVESSPSTFGQMLGELREKYGQTVEQLSELTGVPVELLTAIENGSRRPIRFVAFFEALKDNATFDKDDIVALLRTSDAPKWLISGTPEWVTTQSVTISSITLRFRLAEGSDIGQVKSDLLSIFQRDFPNKHVVIEPSDG